MTKNYWIVAFIIFGLITSFGTFTYAQNSADTPFEFALIGDLPYSGEQEAKFPNLIADINQSPAAFVVHDGDIKSGGSLCDDATFVSRKQLFDNFAMPFILIYGDLLRLHHHPHHIGHLILSLPSQLSLRLRRIPLPHSNFRRPVKTRIRHQMFSPIQT